MSSVRPIAAKTDRAQRGGLGPQQVAGLRMSTKVIEGIVTLTPDTLAQLIFECSLPSHTGDVGTHRTEY